MKVVAKVLLVVVALVALVAILGVGIMIGSSSSGVKRVGRALIAGVESAMASGVESKQVATEVPPSYENEDGPGEGFDSSQIPAGIVFDLRDEIQGRYGDANINVINQTGGIVKEGEASIKVELDPCLEIDKVGFRPWALSWMVQEDKPDLFKPNIFPKAIEKVFGDGFDIPRMLPDNNFICYIPIRVKKGTPSLDSGPVLVILYAKAKGQGWSQVDLEKIWF